MFFKQLLDPELGCASYIVGCAASGKGAVIDPLANLGVETYALEAADQGLSISHVIDTHIHADHISLGPKLAKALGAGYFMDEASPATYAFTPLHPGEVIDLGNIDLKVVHTPGHTPESLSLLVVDHTRTDEPWMVLTGDSLFVGDVARPDLLLGKTGEGTAAERAEVLYDTMQWFLRQPDYLEVYPGHYGASTCGGENMSAKTTSTIGFERRHNVALKQGDKASFVHFVLGHLRPHPDRYQEIKLVNHGELAEAMQ